ncbi:MAG: RNA polymerase sigma factor, partial [Bacteroidota bacterium]
TIRCASGNVFMALKINAFCSFCSKSTPGWSNSVKYDVLSKGINTLPEAQRIVFTLHHIDGLPYSEIAQITERSKSSVESLLFRARKRVKERLIIFFKKEGW